MLKTLRLTGITILSVVFLFTLVLANHAQAAYYTINANTTINGYLAVEGAILADHNEIVFNASSAVDPIINLGKGDSKIREMGDLYVTSNDYIHLGSSVYSYGAVLIQTPAEIAARSIAATGTLRAGVVDANLVGDVTGNVTGDVTGDVTGHSSDDLALAGGTMEGDINLDDFNLVEVGDLATNTVTANSEIIASDFIAANSLNVGSDAFIVNQDGDITALGDLDLNSGVFTVDSNMINFNDMFTANGVGDVYAAGDMQVDGASNFGDGVSIGDNFSVDADGNIYSAGGIETYDAAYLDDTVDVGGLSSLNGGIRVHDGDFLVDVYGLVTAPSYNGLILSTNVDGFSVAGGTLPRTLTLTDNNVVLDQSLTTIDSPTFNILTATTFTDGTATISTGDYSSTGTMDVGDTTVTNLVNTGAFDIRGSIYNGAVGNVVVNDDLEITLATYANGGIDRSTAAALNIGGVNATSINFAGGYGSTGVTISSAGNLQMNGTLTVGTTSTLTGNVDANAGLDVTGAALTATNAVDFSGATSMRVPQGTGLTTAGTCGSASDVGKIYYSTSTAGNMTSGHVYVCTGDADYNGATGDYAWQTLN